MLPRWLRHANAASDDPAHSNTHAASNANANTNSDADAHTNSNADTHTGSDADAYSRYTNTAANTDAGANCGACDYGHQSLVDV